MSNADNAAISLTPASFEDKAVKWDSFSATMAAEGQFEMAGVEESEENFISAYQYLVDTGLVWHLQGTFGRTAQSLIDAGLVTPKA